MLLYYFEDKAEVLGAALQAIAGQMAGGLDEQMPAGKRLSPSAFAVKAAEITRSEDLRPFFRLWVEIIAAAARDEAPFADIARAIAVGFIQWIDERLNIKDDAARHAEAAKQLALIDGLMLLEICTDAETADAAATRLG